MVHELVIIGCSRRKNHGPAPALELYEGWCVPHLRSRIGNSAVHRQYVLILSARYGLVSADQPLHSYDHVMTPERADELRDEVTAELHEYVARNSITETLVLVPPTYVPALPERLAPTTHVITDPVRHWDAAAAVLSDWGWP